MTEWLLVRHGETDWNAEGRFQGQISIPLNRRGIRQAEALRGRLSKKEIKAVYTSDLPRAVETARIILQDHNTSLFLCPELREISYGGWEGLTFAEAQAQDESRFNQLLIPTKNFSPPQGESIANLIKRVSSFASELKARYQEGALLIVSHGGPLRVLIIYLLDLPLSAFWKLHLAPAGLSVVEVYSERCVLKLLNDTSHYENLP